jgi:transposase
MKNKMLKRSHLSEKTCREIIQLFSDDLTATQIADITGVSRVTINNYLKLIRTHITRHCEEESLHHLNTDNTSFADLSKQAAEDLDSRDDESLNIYYGFYKVNGNIFVDGLNNIDKSGIYELQQAKMQNTGTGHQNGLRDLMKYHAIADFDAWRLYRIDNNANSKMHADEITAFWGNAKSRLLKFRGLNRNTLYLHVKECEFRYNNRNDNINNILLNIIYKHPLHLSKAYL